jgi:cysteine protease ATG4
MKVLGDHSASPEGEQEALKSIPHFCYRKSFPPIGPQSLTCDRGWGCCFRSCQGILAQFVLQLHKRHFSHYTSLFGAAKPLSLFSDVPSVPFSIHRLVTAASHFGVPIGEWGKPSSVAVAIQSIVTSLGGNCIVSSHFGVSRSNLMTTFPALLLIPGLLGLRQFDLACLPFLHISLCVPGALGIVSGRHQSAFYIVGFDTAEFVCFDPHTTRDHVAADGPTDSYFDIRHTMIKHADINPSVLIGFIVSSLTDLEDLITLLSNCAASPIAFTEDIDEAACEAVLDIDDLSLD